MSSFLTVKSSAMPTLLASTVLICNKLWSIEGVVPGCKPPNAIFAGRVEKICRVAVLESGIFVIIGFSDVVTLMWFEYLLS